MLKDLNSTIAFGKRFPTLPQVFGKIFEYLYCFGRQRRTKQAPASQKLCVPLGRLFRVMFCGDGCKCMIFFWLVGGEVTGWYFRGLQSSALWFQPVWDLSLFTQCVMATFHLGWGMNVLVPTEQIKDVYQMMYTPWGGIRTRVLLLSYYHYFFNSFFGFVSAFLSFLSSQEMHGLLFGLREGTRLKPFSTNKKQGTWRGFVPRRPMQGPARFQRHKELLLQSSLETCVCAMMELEKENQGKNIKQGEKQTVKAVPSSILPTGPPVLTFWLYMENTYSSIWLSLKTVWEE